MDIDINKVLDLGIGPKPPSSSSPKPPVEIAVSSLYIKNYPTIPTPEEGKDDDQNRENHDLWEMWKVFKINPLSFFIYGSPMDKVVQCFNYLIICSLLLVHILEELIGHSSAHSLPALPSFLELISNSTNHSLDMGLSF